MSERVQNAIDELDGAFFAFREKHERELEASRKDRAKHGAELAELRAEVREVQNAAARINGGGPVQPSSRSMEAWNIIARSGNLEKLTDLGIRAAATVGEDPSGGFLVVEELDREIVKLAREQTAMRRLARVRSVSSSELTILVSKNNAAAGRVGETSDRPETDSPDLAKITIPVREYYANPRATQKELDDAGIDAGAWLTESVADALSALEGEDFITGDSVIGARGILTYDTSTAADASRDFGTIQVIHTGASGAFASSAPANVFFNTVAALKPRYRRNARWLMNSATRAAAAELQDDQGRYLLQPDVRGDGLTDRILGYPIEIDENMPDIAADSLSIALADWMRAYTIADGPKRMLRDPYTAKPYVQFYTTARTGGGLVDSEALKIVKFSA